MGSPMQQSQGIGGLVRKKCFNRFSNEEKALEGGFSVIVKSSFEALELLHTE